MSRPVDRLGMRTPHSPPAATSAVAQSSAPSRSSRLAVMGVLAGLAALTAAHAWINILRVPWVRPVGALFQAGPASNEGWAAWYVPPLFAAVLTLALLHLYFRRSERWTLLALAVAGLFAVVSGGWAAYWVKNIGYTWYFVPGASVAAILGVQPQMAAFAFGRAALIFQQQPLLLAIGTAAGVVAALLLRLPLRAMAPAAPAGSPTLAEQMPMQRSAGLPSRLMTAALMALLGGAVASHGIAPVGVAIGPIVGLVWFFVSFRGGRYVFANVLAGSIAIAVLAALPLTLLLSTMTPSFGNGPGGGLDLRSFMFGVAVRLPVFVLLSIGLIKLALFMSRKLQTHFAR